MDGPFQNRVALITGGTAGIGLATGLALARGGAQCVLTYRWGSADENEIRSRYAALGAPEPLIIEADVASDDDTDSLIETIRERHGRVDIFVSNVAFAQVIRKLADYGKRALHQSIDYTVWPLVAYTLRLTEKLGTPPRYVVGLSSCGPDACIAHYDFIAVCKGMLETFARYLGYRLGETTRVNVVRAGPVKTESLRAVLGDEFIPFAERLGLGSMVIQPEEVASTIAALCSGLLDGMNGQILTVDRGAGLRGDLASLDTLPAACNIPPPKTA